MINSENTIWILIAVFGAGLAFIIFRVLFAARGVFSEPDEVGRILLSLAAIGAGLALFMDTSVSTSYGRVNNLGLMKDQQNYLMVCGVMAIIGTILVVRRR